MEAASLLLGVRRFFGWVAPGGVLLLTLALIWPTPFTSLTTRFASSGMRAAYFDAFLIVLAFFLGGVVSNIFLGLLKALSLVLDSLPGHFSHTRFVQRLIRRHILNPRTFESELRLQLGRSSVAQIYDPVDTVESADRWGAYKLHVLQHSAPLTKELLDIESELNLLAGLFPSFVILTVLGYMHGNVGIAVLLTFVCCYIPFRVSYLCRKEVLMVAAAYLVLFRQEHSQSSAKEPGA